MVIFRNHPEQHITYVLPSNSNTGSQPSHYFVSIQLEVPLRGVVLTKFRRASCRYNATLVTDANVRMASCCSMLIRLTGVRP